MDQAHQVHGVEWSPPWPCRPVHSKCCVSRDAALSCPTCNSNFCTKHVLLKCLICLEDIGVDESSNVTHWLRLEVESTRQHSHTINCNILLSSCLETKRGTYGSWMHWMGGFVYITCVTLNVPRGGTTGKLLVIL